MTGSDRSGPPPDELEQMVPVRRGAVAAIVIVTVVLAFVVAYVWWATFPDVDEGRPPPGAPGVDEERTTGAA